jgi:adenine-specific DNA-methyltransferase
MRGFVPTPKDVVDAMVSALFAQHAPCATHRLLDPGCGDGEFIQGVLRFCARTGAPIPTIIGVEQHAGRAQAARDRFAAHPTVHIVECDFLEYRADPFDWVIGNPPYVAITSLGLEERQRFRARFSTAVGRFDLYGLFFERAIELLAARGRLVFVTPEKYTYVATGAPLRRLLQDRGVASLTQLKEDAFPGLVTYPLVTVVDSRWRGRATHVQLRDGTYRDVVIDDDASWMARLQGYCASPTTYTLADVVSRVSCGVATGADACFVLRRDDVADALVPFAHQVVSGRELTPTGVRSQGRMLIAPYDAHGVLIPEARLGVLAEFLRAPQRRALLNARSCVARKPWYAFHDTFPAADLKSPKILCKDITERPFFVADREGRYVPQHSVYYMVPRTGISLADLIAHLNSPESVAWLQAHCQRAAGGFLRVQSAVLRALPVPDALAQQVVEMAIPQLALA